MIDKKNLTNMGAGAAAANRICQEKKQKKLINKHGGKGSNALISPLFE